MSAIMTDNAGGFSSDEMLEVMSILDMMVITTVAEMVYVSKYML